MMMRSGELGTTTNRFVDNLFYAKDAYDCLTSVPFDPAVALRFIDYYNATIQFQSTLDSLKAPPSSYQQPAVDIVGGLQRIKQEIDDGQFRNQYAFEVALQSLIYSAHDMHLNLIAGVLAVFTFASPVGLVAVSTDGIETPKVFITGTQNELFEHQSIQQLLISL